MAKNEKRVKITLACEQCKRRNYITMKSKVNDRERIEMNVELIQPIAMDQGLRFAIREGGRTVGSGVVTEIVE